MENTIFGKNLCKIRKKRGLTQNQLAIKLNVSPQAVSKWEKNSYPDGDLLPLIAKTLDTSLDVLFGLKEEEKSIDLEQAIANEVHKTPNKDKGELMMKILYSGICAYNDYNFDSVKLPKNLSMETYAQVQTDFEMSLARLNEDLQYFCFLRIPPNGVNSYLNINERILNLFKLLSDIDTIKILFELESGRRNHLQTKEVLSKTLDIPLEKVSSIIDTLDKMGVVWELKVESTNPNKPQSVYGYAHPQGVPIVMMLVLAQSFSNYIKFKEPLIEPWEHGAFRKSTENKIS